MRAASTVSLMTADAPGVSTTLARRIGLRIRAALAGADVTQEQLAERIGKSQPWVSRRIIGVTPADASDIELIAAALGVPVADLLPAEQAAGGAR